jgi:uncharacterized membrane protein YeaQ/YmgE (transglycosylase-associated protein family)
VIFLIVLIVNVILGFIAGSVWRRKGGGYGIGFVMGLLGGFVGLGYVLIATPEETS